MKNLNLKDILNLINGQIIQGNKHLVIKNVSTRLEKITPNTLFFHFSKTDLSDNLHRFRKSTIVVTENPNTIQTLIKKPLTIVKVNDVNKAYWSFINYYRNLFQIPVIGVTGTCGKTTTVEILKTVLAKKYKLQATSNGRNSHMHNLPYLMGFDNTTEAAVFELAVAVPKNITIACRYFKPQVGILLNIGTYHLTGCKTLDNYIKAKAELLKGLESNGTLILNKDDKNIQRINLSSFKGNIIYFGFNQQAQFRADNVKYEKEGMEFVLHHQNKTFKVYIAGYGEHNVYNALATIAACHTIGIDIEETIKLLTAYTPLYKHLEFRSGINGCTVIDDTWNCTPPSMESALKVLQAKANSRKTIAVLGRMPRLGKAGYSEYARIGKIVVETGVDLLVIVGDEAKKIGGNAIKLGFPPNKVFYCKNGNDLFKILYPQLDKNTLVLLKIPYKYRLKKQPSFQTFMKKILRYPTNNG